MLEEMSTLAVTNADSLTDLAYRQIKSRILSIAYVPGEWLTERQIATDLELGLSPVRNAMLRLDNEGLLVKASRRGYQVRPLTLKRVDDIFRAWILLAPELASLAAQKATEADFDDLRRVFDESFQETEGGPSQGQDMFETFCRIADNEILTGFYRKLDSEIERLYNYLEFLSPGGRQSLHAADLSWVRFYAQHDAAAAAAAVRGHLEELHASLMQALVSSASVMNARIESVRH